MCARGGDVCGGDAGGARRSCMGEGARRGLKAREEYYMKRMPTPFSSVCQVLPEDKM